MVMPGRDYSAGTEYRFGFNGKEKDKNVTIGDYDFGARIYDGRIARWLSLDPLQKKYPGESHYVFVANSPLAFIDKDGKDKIIIHNTIFEYGNGITVTVTKIEVIKGVFETYKRDDGKYEYYDIVETRPEYVVSGNSFASGPGTNSFSTIYRGALDIDINEINTKHFLGSLVQMSVEKAFKEMDRKQSYVNRGGIRFTSEHGENNDGPYSSYTDIKSENIDLLLAALKGMAVADLGHYHAPPNFNETVKNILGALDNVQKISFAGYTFEKWLKSTKKMFNVTEEPVTVHCNACGTDFKDSSDNWVESKEPPSDTMQTHVDKPSETPLKKKN
jgi:RHS repeat-associated protein